MMSKLLTTWLALTAYVVGGLVLPVVHVHSGTGQCSLEAHAECDTAEVQVCCSHSSTASKTTEPATDVSDVLNRHGEQQHQEHCLICDLFNTPAQNPDVVQFVQQDQVIQVVDSANACLALCVDLRMPPLRGPPSLI